MATFHSLFRKIIETGKILHMKKSALNEQQQWMEKKKQTAYMGHCRRKFIRDNKSRTRNAKVASFFFSQKRASLKGNNKKIICTNKWN